MSKVKVSWDNIIDDFFSGCYRAVERNPRNGLRGRIFQELVKKLLVYDGFIFEHEVTFEPKPIDSDFKKKAISIDENINVNQKGYTIDFVLNNGTWVEATLNIHTAHEKPLKYAHQCEKLVVLYIDKTTKQRVGNVFNNVKIISVFKFFSKKAIKNYRKEINKIVEYKGIYGIMKDDFEKDLDSLLEKIEEEIEVDDEFIPRAVNTLHSMPNIHDYCNMDIVFLNGDVVVFSGSPDLPIVIPSINIIVTSRPYVLGDLKADLEFVSVEEKENPSWSSILSTYGQDHVI